MANKKVVSVLSTAAIGTLIASAIGSTVFAAVDGLVVKNAAGAYLNYDLDALKASVVNDALGTAGAELYKDFDAARTAGSIASYHDDKVGFVDAAAVQKAALDSALAGTSFVLDTFTESAKETVLPATVYQATVTNGKVVAGAEVKPTTQVTTALAVQSVTALNATQASVVFTQAVLGGTAINANLPANYSIGGVAPATAVLQADGKTVILTFATAAPLTGAANAGVTNAAVVIEPIASASNALTLSPRYVSLLTYKDSVKPAIASITSTTNGAKASTVTVKFTEPVNSLGSVKIDGVGVVGVQSADKISATFTIDLDAAANHTIQFFGLTDMVGNVADLFTQGFSITVDKVAPTVVVAPSADVDNAFTLTFSKDMDATSVTTAAITVADETLGATFGGVTITQPDLTNKKVYLVKGAGAIFGTKATRTFTVVLPATISDTLGNTFAVTTTSVTLTKDTVKPAFTGVKVVKDAAGKVTSIEFATNSTLSASSIAGLSVVNSSGVLETTVSAPWTVFGLTATVAGDKKIVLTPAGAPITLTGKYTFNFAAGTVSDQAQTANTSAVTSQVVDFGAATAGNGTFTIPAANVAANSLAIQPAANNNVYTVNFGTAVKGGDVVGSATDLSKYTINGNALPAGTTITLDAATKSTATITLPAGSIAKTDAAAIFYINGVQDTSGNTVVAVTTTVKVNDTVKPVINSAVLNIDNTITVGVSEELAAAPGYTTDLVVKVNGVAVTGLAVTPGTGADYGKYVIGGLGAFLKYDGTSITYFDFDNSNTITAGDITLSTVGGDKKANKLADFNAITSLTVSSATAPTATDKAAVANALTGSTTLTIK